MAHDSALDSRLSSVFFLSFRGKRRRTRLWGEVGSFLFCETFFLLHSLVLGSQSSGQCVATAVGVVPNAAVALTIKNAHRASRRPNDPRPPKYPPPPKPPSRRVCILGLGLSLQVAGVDEDIVVSDTRTTRAGPVNYNKCGASRVLYS